MEVRFREVDPFNCWIWLRYSDVPSKGEREYVDGIFDSWYVLGRLGGFNSENLQTHEMGSDISWMSYENDDTSSNLPSLMHNLGEFEFNECWASGVLCGTCWGRCARRAGVDLGTSDLIAIDVLINVLKQMDVDVVKIEELIIGGVNEDWPVEEHPDAIFSSTD